MSFPDLDSIVSFAKALGGVATFAISVVSFVIAYRIWRRQEEGDRRASAELVNAWMVSGEIDDQDHRDLSKRNLLIVQNGGVTPIYRVSVETVTEGNPLRAPTLKPEWLMLPPGTYICRVDRYRTGKNVWSLPKRVLDEELSGYAPWVLDEKHLVRGLGFTDASGFTWTRDERGLLKAASHASATPSERNRRARGTSRTRGDSAESAA